MTWREAKAIADKLHAAGVPFNTGCDNMGCGVTVALNSVSLAQLHELSELAEAEGLELLCGGGLRFVRP